MKNLDQLQAEKRELLNSLDDNEPVSKRSETIQKIKELETQMQEQKIISKLNNVNIEQKRLREAAKKVWEAETPTIEIMNEDGSFHKTKIKKFPKLAELDYLRGETDKDKVIALNYKGKRFQLYRMEYKYNEPTKYIEFENFKAFLDWHGINEKDITLNQFKKFLSDLEKAQKELENNLEKYENKLKSLNKDRYSHIGLINQFSKNVYTYKAATY